MKNHLCILSALLIVVLCVVPTAYAQEYDSTETMIDALYNMGLSTWEIAEIADGGFTDHETNMLKVSFAMVWFELCRRNINPFEEMPDTELEGLLNTLIAIQEARNAKDVTIPPGMYLVGDDIPAGDYTIFHTGKPAATYEDTNVYIAPIITVFKSDQKTVVTSFMAKIDEPVGKLTLEEGCYVKIDRSSAVFTPYEGLGF